MASEAARAPGLPKTAWSLAALAIGLAAGVLLHRAPLPGIEAADVFVGAIGRLWIAALRLVAIPLVVTQTLAAVAGVRREASVAALAGRALLLFGAMLLAGGVLAFGVAAPIVRLYPVHEATAAALQPQAPGAAEAGRPAAPSATPSASWLDELVPDNIFHAAAAGKILPVLLFSVAFGLAVAHLPSERRAALEGLFAAHSGAMLVLVGWILKALPVGVFAIAYSVSARGGGGALSGFLTFYVALVCGVLLLVTALLYPVTALLGRVSVARFARGVAPAQLVAAGSRSSLASLPALVEGAQAGLALTPLAAGFLLPFSVALFKLNRTASSAVKVLVLSHMLGLSLAPWQLAVFLATEMVISFSAVGVPRGGGQLRSLPAYLALGIPIEGLVLFEAVDDIPDIFKTVTNVTGDMSVAAILCRPVPAGSSP